MFNWPMSPVVQQVHTSNRLFLVEPWKKPLSDRSCMERRLPSHILNSRRLKCRKWWSREYDLARCSRQCSGWSGCKSECDSEVKFLEYSHRSGHHRRAVVSKRMMLDVRRCWSELREGKTTREPCQGTLKLCQVLCFDALLWWLNEDAL
jgi:hypothetical protein